MVNWSYIVFSYLALFALGLIDNFRGPVYPLLLEQFSLSPVKGALFFSLASGAGLAANLCAHWWLRNWGAFNSMRAFILFQAIGTLGMGLCPLYSLSFRWMLFFALFFGVSLGGLGVVVNILVVEGAKPGLRLKALSGLHSMYGVASLLAPLLMSSLVKVKLGWEWGFVFLSVGAFSLFLLSFMTGGAQSKSQFQRQRPQSQPLSQRKTRTQSAGDKMKHSDSKNRQLPLVKRMPMAMILALYVGGEMAITTRLVYFLTDYHRWGQAEASLYLSYFFVLLLLGRLIGASVTIPLSNLLVLRICSFVSFVFFILGLFVDPGFLVACGLSMSVFFPTAMSLISEVFGEKSSEVVATSMTSIAVILIGLHWGIGVLAEFHGIKLALLLGAVFLFFGFSLLVLARKSLFSLE